MTNVLATVLLLGLMASPLQAAGFPNVAYPQAGVLLSGPHAPTQGRTALVAFHNGVLYSIPEVPSSHSTPEAPADYQVRSWDIADPTQPQVVEVLGTTRHPISAHGYLVAGNQLVVGDNLGTGWAFAATDVYGVNTRGFWADQPGGSDGGIGDRGRLYHPFHINMWWSYGAVSGNAVLSRVGGFDNSNQPLGSWNHLADTGVIGHPFIVGNLLIFASEDTRTGVATYDISDPGDPVLLDLLTSGGPGGYWPELWGGDGKLYVVWPYRTFGRGMRVADITDPSDIRWVVDLPLPGDEPMYAQFQDEYAFIANHKIDMRTLTEVVTFDSANAVHTVPGNPYNPSGVGINTSEHALPLGNLLVTGGNGRDQGMAIWVHDTQPDTRGPEVGYHIPRAGQTNYPLNLPISLLIHETLDARSLVNGETFIVRAVGGLPLAGHLILAFDDTLTFTPFEPLLPETTYEVLLTAGGLRDAAGNATTGYTFSFSTGSSVGGNSPPQINSFIASTVLSAPGGEIVFTANAIDPDSGGGLEYRFDAADGRPKTEWGDANQIAFTYTQPGHYQVLVQARDSSGSITTASVNITVVDPPAGPPATHSSQIRVASNGRAWVVNPDNDSLTAFDVETLAVEVEVAVCADPRSVDVDGGGDVWITCHDADRIEVRSGGDGSLIAAIDTGYGSAPFGIAMAPTGATAYVSLYGSGRLLRLDVAARAIDGSVAVGPSARAVAVSGDGLRVLVSRFISPLNHGEIWDVDAATLTLSRTLRLPKIGGIQGQDGTANGRGVPNYLAALALAPDGASVWVVGNKPNVERGTLFGAALDDDNSVRNLALRVDLTSGAVDRIMDIDNSDSASALTFSPLGDYLFVTLQGNNEVVVFDALTLSASTGLGGIVTRLQVGLAPQGVAIDPITNRILVSNFMDRSVSVFDGAPLLQNGAIDLNGSTLAAVTVEALPPQVLRGKQVFYNAGDPRMSAEGYISCASCHVDGGSDGRVWDFTQRGEGLRNTTELRGRAGIGHGNVHWSANFDEIQDFENDIRSGFGGTGFLSPDDFDETADTLGALKAGRSSDLDALAAYVSSLTTATLPRSPYRTANGALTAAGSAGRDVFVASSCHSCHSGPGFTDSVAGATALLHDVGTLRSSSGQRLGGVLAGIDTPTLLGVWANAPYFHNGSAHDLEDVFVVAGGTIIEAESGTISVGLIEGGVGNILNNYDNTVSGGLALIEPTGSLVLSNVDGGGGGSGAIELRYSIANAGTAIIRVNGVEHLLALPATGNDPLGAWRRTFWDTARLEGVDLTADATNTIEIGLLFGGFAVDHVTVSTADHLAAAVHRGVLDLPEGDRGNLVAFLNQLDNTPVTMPTGSEPTATITLAAGQSEPIALASIDFDIELSRPVEGLGLDDFLVAGSAGGSAAALTTMVTGTHFRLRVDGATLAGTVSVFLPSDRVVAVDDGSPNLSSNTIIVDVVPPPPADDLAPLSDELDDGTTTNTWLRNYVEEGWNADKLEIWNIHDSRSGHMRLMPYSSTWFNDYTGALAYKEVSGDFVATIQLDVGRRNGLPGRPASDYSWAGLLVRAPRGLTQAAPVPDPGPGVVLPWPPPPFGEPNHYTTPWQPGTENYIYLASGFATNAINANPNVWQYEAKSTTNGVSSFYSSANGTGTGVSVSTLQIVRIGQTFVLLRRHGDGPWIVETRYELPAMPDTLQIGLTAYGDWNYVSTQNELHHNRTAAVGVGNPDIVADVDFYRLQRPHASLSEAALQALALTGPFGPLQLLADSGLDDRLGDHAHAPYVAPTATPTPGAATSTPTRTPTATPTTTPTATTTDTPPQTCPETPRPDCAAPQRAKLKLREGEGRRRKLEWRWDGPSAGQDLGTPLVAGDAIGVCTYVDNVRLTTATIPTGSQCGARPCWAAMGMSGYQLRDRSRQYDGIDKVQLIDKNGSMRLRVKGGGTSLAAALPITESSAVTVQVSVGTSAGCWESRFEPPARLHRADRYSATLP